ncbi:hypothetical protein N7495_000276 [Penicillium taxi]|uniref:uncharacterized protein n=1 Tax=Penicillium taxi TaxID=168475 RepID=UPI00254588BC|nr:uncharacterized protein N7495_000276 [Penicillium taxi]KAJ5907594.1 hypothetical protein N7495_000276 [Penicillium taxi]
MAPVLSASTFSLPLPPWLQPTSTRVAQYDRQKRKKSIEYTDDNGDGADTTDAASVAESVPARQSLILTPNEAHQYRTAGLSFDQELPGGQFPHAPPKKEQPNKQNLPGHLPGALASLTSPVYPPQAAAHQGNVRLQHLAVLTAILHRCLLQRDYIRAGRAWGLLLREEFRGIPLDVRSEGRWGIGAEILLRKGQQKVPAEADHSLFDNTQSPFTSKGFADAQEYYERLILNHPFAKSSPNSISALHFYPAMFGLWIYTSQEESDLAREKIALNSDDLSDVFSDDGNSSIDFERREAEKRQTMTSAVRAKELEQAQQIAARLGSLLASPPYSDSSELLELQGMVSLWIGDLLISSLVTSPEDGEEYDPEAMLIDSNQGSMETRRQQQVAIERRQAELEKAREFLEKARQRGKSVAENLKHLHIGDGSPSPFN